MRVVARLREPRTRTATRTSTKRLATDDESRHPEQSTIGHQDQLAERKSCSFDKGIRGVQSSALSSLRREASHLLRPREYGRAGKGRSRCDAVGTQGGRGTRSVGTVGAISIPSLHCHLQYIQRRDSSCFLSPLESNPSESQRMMLNGTFKTYSQVQSATLGFVHALLTLFRPLPRVTYSQVRGPLCLRRSPTRICSARSARTSCGRRAAPATAGTCSATRA